MIIFLIIGGAMAILALLTWIGVFDDYDKDDGFNGNPDSCASSYEDY